MTEGNNLICPHCRSNDIPYGANICKGCRAEIKYGTPGYVKIAGFILPIIMGWYPAKYLGLHGVNETFALIVFGLITVIGWYAVIRLCVKLFQDNVVFTRQVSK